MADLFLIAMIYPIVNRFYHQHWTPESATLVLTTILAFTVSAEMCSLYRPWRVERFRVEIRTVFLAWTMTVAALVLIGFATKTSTSYSRVVSFGWFVTAPVVLSAWRLLVRSVLRGLRASGFNTRQVAILGATEAARGLFR